MKLLHNATDFDVTVSLCIGSDLAHFVVLAGASVECDDVVAELAVKECPGLVVKAAGVAKTVGGHVPVMPDVPVWPRSGPVAAHQDSSDDEN